MGTVHQKSSMFLRNNIGEASGENGNTYELTTAFGDGTPIVQSMKTRQYFTLNWSEIIHMAIEAGVDNEIPEEKTDAKVSGDSEPSEHQNDGADGRSS